MKETVAKQLANTLKQKEKDILPLLETPPNLELGDWAYPCFSLAKEKKKNPIQIAEELAKELSKDLPEEIEKIKTKGAYLNFYLNKKLLTKHILKETKKKKWGSSNLGKGKNLTIDLSSPNIAKPFGIGHLRSTIIGNAIANIAKANGMNVTKINYLGDWGTQFGKIILGYKKFGDEKKLEKEPIKHLYEIYVQSNKEEYEELARKEFKKLEEGDKENISLWKKFRELSLKEFNDIYKLLGITFDVTSGESVYNNKMDPTIQELKEKKIAKKDQGALIVDLKEEGLGVAIMQKSDGTSLYHTRDLTAAITRKKKYDFDMNLYEVGQEQTLYFKQLFKILELLGYEWAKKCIHTGHGLYLDKDGKKFATRKGKTIFMKEVILETIEKAKENIRERAHSKITEEELERRARIVALAAIYYGDLKVQLRNDVIFDIERFLSFEGNTGPYLLYTYARASTIINKKKSNNKKDFNIQTLEQPEITLIKKIGELTEVLEQAYKQLSPNIIANYAYSLSKTFNEFYHECPVLGNDAEGFRIELVNAYRTTIKKALDLLGIETLEEM